MNKDVIERLATVARGGIEKEGRFLANMFTKVAPKALGQGMHGPPAMTRQFSLGRTAATLGGAGALGAYGYGLHNQAQHETGATINPFTWAGWGNTQQQHDNSFGRWKGMHQQGQNEMNDALLAGRDQDFDRIKSQMESGSYGSSGGPSLGGLNPFYRPGMGQYEQDVGRINKMDTARQGRLQARMKDLAIRGDPSSYDTDIAAARAKGDTAQVDQLTQQQQLATRFGSQLDSLKTRMGQAQTIPGIRAKMQQTPSGPAGGPPAGHWMMGNRPGYPGAFQGWAMNPHDYRRDPSSHNVWEEVLARSGQQGGLVRPH